MFCFRPWKPKTLCKRSSSWSHLFTWWYSESCSIKPHWGHASSVAISDVNSPEKIILEPMVLSLFHRISSFHRVAILRFHCTYHYEGCCYIWNLWTFLGGAHVRSWQEQPLHWISRRLCLLCHEDNIILEGPKFNVDSRWQFLFTSCFHAQLFVLGLNSVFCVR